MTKFNPGTTYSDIYGKFEYTIIRRTAKSVWVEVMGYEQRKPIKTHEGVEYFEPHTNLKRHMYCTINADKVVS